jgi:hypothetical protein
VSPSRKRAAVCALQTQFTVSERRACQALGQPRSSRRNVPQPRSDEAAVVKRMLELFRQRPRPGYGRIGRLLAAEGRRMGQSHLFRLGRREGLKVPNKKRNAVAW